MPKLKQKDLNRMIENAVSYKQESVTDYSSSFMARCKNLFSRPKAYCLTAASFLVLLVAISPLLAAAAAPGEPPSLVPVDEAFLSSMLRRSSKIGGAQGGRSGVYRGTLPPTPIPPKTPQSVFCNLSHVCVRPREVSRWIRTAFSCRYARSDPKIIIRTPNRSNVIKH